MNPASNSHSRTETSPPEVGAQLVERLERLWQAGQAPDLHEFLTSLAVHSPRQIAELVRVDIRERWLRGERVLVEHYLQMAPVLESDPDLLLDLIYEEYCLRESRKEAARPEEYLERFPALGDRLKRQFEVHRALDDSSGPASITSMYTGADAGSMSSQVTWLHEDGARSAPRARVPYGAKPPQIPGYEILGEIDRGGMGVVYKARQAGLNRIVALKMILGGAYAGPEQLARFMREAESVARLKHPNIIQIYEVGEHDGQPFFSLEYAEGGSLARRLAGRPQPPLQAAQTLAILARAVHAAHQCGIIHRDLKPANVLLTADDVPKVTDFGLAKQLGEESGQTRSGVIMGTPSYMAPEQAMGKAGAVSAATDIYALGAILYELLTGRPPFSSENSFDTLQQVLLVEPVHPIQLRPGVPRDLETICLKCLAKEPSKRYPSSHALAEDLQRFLDGEPIRARRVSVWERAWKWARRRPAIAALSLLLVFVALSGFAGILAQWREALAARAEAQTLQRKAEQQLYALSIVYAETALSGGDAEQARRSLQEAPTRLRNWEWHYLNRLCETSGRALAGHDQDVTCVACSPDGRFLATGGIDCSVRVWDAALGKEVKLFAGHERRISHVAFNPSERQLASCDDGGRILLWNLDQDGDPVELLGHRGFVASLAYLPLTGQLASAGEDQDIHIWDLASHREVARFRGHDNYVFGLACSPDGKLLASGGKDQTVRLWDAKTGQALRVLQGHGERVLAVAFSADGSRLASCGKDASIRLWDPFSGQQVGLLTAPTSFVSSVAFQPSSSRLAAVCGEPGSGELRMWDLSTGSAVPSLRGLPRRISQLVFNPKGDRLATAMADGTIILFDTDLALGSNLLQGHVGSITALAHSPDGRTLASVGYDKQLCIWNTTTGQHVREPLKFDDWLYCLAWSGDGRFLAVAGELRDIVVLDTGSWNEVARLVGHAGAIRSIVFSRDGSRLVSASEDSTLKVWDIPSGRQLGDLHGVLGEVTCLALSSDGRFLAGGGKDMMVRVWNFENGQLLNSYKQQIDPARCLVFSPDGKQLVIGSGTESHGDLAVWNWASAPSPVVWSGHKGYVLGAAFSPDGTRLASASGDHTVKVWDLVEGKPLLTLVGPTQDVQSVQFSPDGTRLVAGGVDGLIRVWIGAPLPPSEP